MGNLANQYQQYGSNLANMGQQDATTMYNLGNVQKGQDQQSLDLAYNQFLEQRDYPKTQLEFMNSLVRGLPIQKSAFTTSSPLPSASGTTLSPSPLALAGSALSGASGASNMLYGSK